MTTHISNHTTATDEIKLFIDMVCCRGLQYIVVMRTVLPCDGTTTSTTPYLDPKDGTARPKHLTYEHFWCVQASSVRSASVCEGVLRVAADLFFSPNSNGT